MLAVLSNGSSRYSGTGLPHNLLQLLSKTFAASRLPLQLTFFRSQIQLIQKLFQISHFLFNYKEKFIWTLCTDKIL